MSKSVRLRVRSASEAAVAANEVGLDQFLMACFRDRNSGFKNAGMAVVDSYGDSGSRRMIVDLRDVVTFGNGLQRSIRPGVR